MKNYVLVGDFTTKPETRSISEYLFWKYSIRIPHLNFSLLWHPENPEIELPITVGSGREFEAMNLGRAFFLKGKYQQAATVWLTLKKRFGTKFEFHKRVDHFIALGYMAIVKEMLDEKKDKDIKYHQKEFKKLLGNAYSFYESAWVLKEEVEDKAISSSGRYAYFNLAVMAYMYKRYNQTYLMTEHGIRLLLDYPDSKLRTQFRRLRAETLIYARNYLPAMQELDHALHENKDPKLGSLMLTRIGDIYFSLNNYELAEDIYALANRIDSELSNVSPARFVIRGECLFWMGKFDAAQKSMRYALDALSMDSSLDVELMRDLNHVADLRIADSYLAKNQFDNAKLEYFRISHEYRSSETEMIAKVRQLCLELPDFDGNNINHARNALSKIKEDSEVNQYSRELAWTCETVSYAVRDRTPEMIEKVRGFIERYPNASVLYSFRKPIIETQKKNFSKYIEESKFYQAIDFFEKTRKTYFPKVSESEKKSLFFAYIHTMRSLSARDYFSADYLSRNLSDENVLALAAYLAEVRNVKGEWNSSETELSEELFPSLNQRKWKSSTSKDDALYLARIMEVSGDEIPLGWLMGLLKASGEKSVRYVCDRWSPVYTRVFNQSTSGKQPDYADELIAIVDSNFPHILEVDENCGVALLDHEYDTLIQKPEKLAERYLKRGEWRFSSEILSLYLRLASVLKEKNMLELSRSVYEFVSKNSSANTIESRMSKAALDNSGTVFESIWR